MTAIERKSTGIMGLDEMTQGGFPHPSCMLVVGEAGVGKTTFCLQFLSEGARKEENCLYFTTLSEPPIWVMRFTSGFSFIDHSLIGANFRYLDLGAQLKKMRQPEDILEFIESKVSQFDADRIVIDPINIVRYYFQTVNEYRSFLYDLSVSMKGWNAITILTREVVEVKDYLGHETYTSDGVIKLFYRREAGERTRFIEVVKMRGTDHNTTEQLFSITTDGIDIFIR